jgi:hypothetical protein
MKLDLPIDGIIQAFMPLRSLPLIALTIIRLSCAARNTAGVIEPPKKDRSRCPT